MIQKPEELAQRIVLLRFADGMNNMTAQTWCEHGIRMDRQEIIAWAKAEQAKCTNEYGQRHDALRDLIEALGGDHDR